MSEFGKQSKRRSTQELYLYPE